METQDVGANDLYKIASHIKEALERGDHLSLVDGNIWNEYFGTSLLDRPTILFDLFDGVFERYPIDYVLLHIHFRSQALGFCLDYWQRTRALLAWKR